MARIAQCECGLFKIIVEAEPAVVGVCSWINCQRSSGSVLGALIYFSKEESVPVRHPL